MDNIDYIEGPSLRIIVDMPLLRVDVQEEHLEASEALNVKARAIQFLLVAHDLLKDIGASTLIE